MARVKQPKEKFKRSLNRSLKGDIGIFILLAIAGAAMVIPLVFAIGQSLKPLEEFWVFPPRLFPVNPTLKNFSDLFRLMGTSWVPFSRYISSIRYLSLLSVLQVTLSFLPMLLMQSLRSSSPEESSCLPLSSTP